MKYENIIKKNIFGKNFNSIPTIIDGITSEIQSNKNYYGFLDQACYNSLFEKELLETKEASESMKIYWFEMLERTYLSSVTGFLRFYHWLNGVEASLNSNNIILFESSLRGLLESSCDLYDALENLPITLANNFNIINLAITGKLHNIAVSKEIEDLLIHFQYASKQNSKLYSDINNSIYRPKSAKSYITSTNLSPLNLYECYSKLCELTHPAADSLSVFITNENNLLSINTNTEHLIDDFISSYSPPLSQLIERTFNLLLLLFKTLNYFNIEALSLKYVNNINCESIPAWKKISNLIES